MPTPQELIKQWREEAEHSRRSEEKFNPDSAFGAWHCAAREVGTRHADELEQALAADAEERAEEKRKAAALGKLEANYALWTNDCGEYRVDTGDGIRDVDTLLALAEALPEPKEAETDGNV